MEEMLGGGKNWNRSVRLVREGATGRDKGKVKCDQELTAAGERARDWTERAKKFAGTDMWYAADRADAEQLEKEI